MDNLAKNSNNEVKLALEELDHEKITLDGIQVKPSDCYHFSTDPLHLLFNTNCPDALKEKISGIVQQYYPNFPIPLADGKVPETKEFQLVAEAWINGKLVQRNVDSISGTTAFSDLYLQDLARQFFEDEYPAAKIQLQGVNLIPVN